MVVSYLLVVDMFENRARSVPSIRKMVCVFFLSENMSSKLKLGSKAM